MYEIIFEREDGTIAETYAAPEYLDERIACIEANGWEVIGWEMV